jgi:nucleoside-diphosphate-sugar epimerase
LYAETKVAVERALLDYGADPGPGVTVLRFATLFGLSPRMRFDLTVNHFAAEMLTKGYLQVYGEQFWRPYVHVRDAARAVAMVLEASPDQVKAQVFNVGDSSQNYQKQQLVQLVNDYIGDAAAVEFVHKEEDPRDYRVSFEKIKLALHFHITRTVEDGIREVVDAINQGVIADWKDPRYHN